MVVKSKVTLQFNWIVKIEENLEILFAKQPDVFVSPTGCDRSSSSLSTKRKSRCSGNPAARVGCGSGLARIPKQPADAGEIDKLADRGTSGVPW
jgi:hypothetical protein